MLARPQGEPLVVLRREDDVAGAGTGEQVRPLVGVEQLGLELMGEILVLRALPEDTVVESTELSVALRIRVGPAVPVPLRILGIDADVVTRGAESRDRVHAPVDEDAELGVVVPGRKRACVERGPVSLVACGASLC